MAQKLTVDQADDLIGKTGRVVNPSKGPWEGDYRILGYSPDPEDPDVVASLKAVTVAETGDIHVPDNKGGVLYTVPSHPKIAVDRLNPKWFKPHPALV